MTTLTLRSPQTGTVQLTVSPERIAGVLDDTWSVHLLLQQASSVRYGDRAFQAERGQRLTDCLERIAESLWSAEQRECLASAPAGSSLLIRSDLSGLLIPWEQLPAGDMAAGLRFAIGRQFIGDHSPGWGQSAPFSGTGCVVAAESQDLISTDLEHRMVERRLRHLLTAPGRLFPLNPAPSQLTTEGFQRLLCENTWLHFAGHAQQNAADRTAPRALVISNAVAEEASAVFTVADVQQLAQVPRGLFLNGCGTLQLPLEDHAVFADTLAGAFLERGVELLIGPIVAIADSQSRGLVRSFYDELGAGVSAAEALRRARGAALDSLGPQALLPWCYVLYGDPAAIPFPAAASELELGDVLPRAASPSSEGLYCRCVRCDAVIRTRHGVYTSGLDPACGPLCRGCAASEESGTRSSARNGGTRKRILRPMETAPRSSRGNAASPVAASVASPVTDAVTARTLTDSQRLFVEWLEETLRRPWTWRNPDRQTAASCRFETIGPGAGDDMPAVWGDAADRVAAVRRRELVDEHGYRLPVTFLLATSGDSSAPLDASRLTDILRMLTSMDMTWQQDGPALLVVASSHGFDRQLVDQLQHAVPPIWYGPRISVILWDPAEKVEYRRRLDLLALRFPSLLTRAATTSQIGDALLRLQQLLPLPGSLSSQQLATDWQLEQDAIETAQQIIAVENQLQLDRIPGLGLVISGP